MNVASFKDRGNVDHLLYYNKQVAFLNHPNNQLWRELLYTALDAWYTKFSGKPSKKQKDRFSCGTWVDFFTNINIVDSTIFSTSWPTTTSHTLRE